MPSLAARPSHLFIANDGALHDTRNAEWSRHPLRKGFAGYGLRQGEADSPVQTLALVKAALRAGEYGAGGYRNLFIADDAGGICFDCARSNWRLVCDSILNDHRDGWRVAHLICEAESDDAESCDHCGAVIFDGPDAD